jgi:hypothetical protein
MISLETAKTLKKAGLEWEPKVGDRYLQEYCSGKEPVIGIRATDNEGYYQDTIQTQLPHLDQLLAEIGRRGYRYILDSNPDDETNKFFSPTIKLLEKDNTCKFKWWIVFAECADSPEEATAQALLWILSQK